MGRTVSVYLQSPMRHSYLFSSFQLRLFPDFFPDPVSFFLFLNLFGNFYGNFLWLLWKLLTFHKLPFKIFIRFISMEKGFEREPRRTFRIMLFFYPPMNVLKIDSRTLPYKISPSLLSLKTWRLMLNRKIFDFFFFSFFWKTSRQVLVRVLTRIPTFNPYIVDECK